MAESHWNTIQTTYSTQINAAYANSTFSLIQQQKALAYLDRWIDAEKKADDMSGDNVSSYSIADRSVSREASAELRKKAASAQAQFNSIVFGTVTLADFRTRHGSEEDPAYQTW